MKSFYSIHKLVSLMQEPNFVLLDPSPLETNIKSLIKSLTGHTPEPIETYLFIIFTQKENIKIETIKQYIPIDQPLYKENIYLSTTIITLIKQTENQALTIPDLQFILEHINIVETALIAPLEFENPKIEQIFNDYFLKNKLNNNK